jgi:hypothetical protein
MDPFPNLDRTYRRRVEVRPAPGVVEAEMEDYCHHFHLRIAHNDGTIERVESAGVRFPWETCAAGAAGARSLVGVTLDDAIDAGTWALDRSAQCVHVVDLSLIAVRHALDTTPTSYEAVVTPGSHRRRRATLTRNGQIVLIWSLDGEDVTGPEPFTGLSLSRSAFFAWIRARLPEPQHEAAVVLRRACYIGVSRGIELDVYANAGDLHAPDESCYTYRTDVALTARRVRGSSWPTEVGFDGR